jgi:hypothetical protein
MKTSPVGAGEGSAKVREGFAAQDRKLHLQIATGSCFPLREDLCLRCNAVLHWVHSSLQCPRCKYKEGCCG